MYIYCVQIRTSGLLRSQFQSLSGAFNAHLIQAEKSEAKSKGLRASLSSKFAEVESMVLMAAFCHHSLLTLLVSIKDLVINSQSCD